VRALQTALYHHNGSVNKISIDDKGATLVAAMGLPPLAREDDPARGLLAALDMHSALRGLNWSCAIGVATGRAFCGWLGSETRREYTMIGDVVNLAARLMQAAGRQDLQNLGGREQTLPILCDEATYRAAQTHILLKALPPIRVKGRAAPVKIYRPAMAASPRGLYPGRLGA
jgi:class 3 adenylate cyclase